MKLFYVVEEVKNLFTVHLPLLEYRDTQAPVIGVHISKISVMDKLQQHAQEAMPYGNQPTYPCHQDYDTFCLKEGITPEDSQDVIEWGHIDVPLLENCTK